MRKAMYNIDWHVGVCVVLYLRTVYEILDSIYRSNAGVYLYQW